MTLDIIEAEASLKEAIDHFYVEQGYHGSWSETERAFVCLVESTVIATVKVEQTHGVSILRGMYVKPCYQNQGLGTHLLNHIEPVLNETVAYCMPLAHARAFYEKIGFKDVPMDTYPDFLIERCNGYRDAGYTITTMKRDQAMQQRDAFMGCGVGILPTPYNS